MKQIDVRVLETPKVLGCQRNTRAILNLLNMKHKEKLYYEWNAKFERKYL